MTWLQTLVIKKVRTTSLNILLNINLFLQQKFLTKTCHIMIPKSRDFIKDSKKSSFAILGFFLRFFEEFTSSQQQFENKTKYCRWVPGFCAGVPGTFAIKAIGSFIG